MTLSEDWLAGDPFGEIDDPAAAERERRRREREERRRRRETAETADVPAAPPSPAPRGPEPGPPPPQGRRRRLAVAAVLATMALAVLAIGALAYRYFHRETPPPVTVRTVTVTIPEGFSRAQTAALAREDGLTGSYMAASKGHEGFLFPDTFYLRRHAPARELVRLQLEDFKRRVRRVDMGYARSKNLTLRDVVSIASMIEREAQLESQRKLVAAVIYNRLHEGMPLGIDATIRFATGNYTRPLTESQLAVDSPYNTRLHSGLPPGPIDSPGLASIEAAAHPARVGYLYYVVQPGACGKLAFSSTAAQFERDVARYNAARAAAGGRSPTSCGQ